MAPTLAHFMWFAAPRGRYFSLGRPGENMGPHARPLRVVRCPPEGAIFPWDGPAKKCFPYWKKLNDKRHPSSAAY